MSGVPLPIARPGDDDIAPFSADEAADAVTVASLPETPSPAAVSRPTPLPDRGGEQISRR